MPSRISASPETIRLIILETDEAHPETQDRRGSFGNVLEETFTTAGRQHDPPLGVEAVMKFVVEEKGGKVPSVEEFEGAEAVLITGMLANLKSNDLADISGSMYDAHGDDEWILKLLKLLRGKREMSMAQRHPLSIPLCHYSTSCNPGSPSLQSQNSGPRAPTSASAAYASAIKFSAVSWAPQSNPPQAHDGNSLTLKSRSPQ